jgi:hypothetical protein
MSTETTNMETKATPEITRAAERYLEQYGDPLVMNTYLEGDDSRACRRLPRAGRAHLQEPDALANMHP